MAIAAPTRTNHEAGQPEVEADAVVRGVDALRRAASAATAMLVDGWAPARRGRRRARATVSRQLDERRVGRGRARAAVACSCTPRFAQLGRGPARSPSAMRAQILGGRRAGRRG